MPKTSSASVRHDAVPRAEVLGAARTWAERAREEHPGIRRIGCFGSYARGDYLPSSDLDLFVEVQESRFRQARHRRQELPDPEEIPVGVELFVYTTAEVDRLREQGSTWLATIEDEAIWLGPRS